MALNTTDAYGKRDFDIAPNEDRLFDPGVELDVAPEAIEEIITALSRIRWLFVITRNSTFTYKGKAVNLKQVGRELGVRYVLEGSMQSGRSRPITAQLIRNDALQRQATRRL
jgi:adenylate cyclase